MIVTEQSVSATRAVEAGQSVSVDSDTTRAFGTGWSAPIGRYRSVSTGRSVSGGQYRSVSTGRSVSVGRSTVHTPPDAQTFRVVVGAVALSVPDNRISARPVFAGADALRAVRLRVDAVEAGRAVVVGRYACTNAAVPSVEAVTATV